MDKPFAITLDVGSSLANRTGSWRTNRPVYVDRLPPCNNACPAGENIQSWLYQAESGDYEAAWRALTQDNPLPAIMGRVCYHPCETACNRAQIDDSVNINSVERFLGDVALDACLLLLHQAERRALLGKRVVLLRQADAVGRVLDDWKKALGELRPGGAPEVVGGGGVAPGENSLRILYRHLPHRVREQLLRFRHGGLGGAVHRQDQLVGLPSHAKCAQAPFDALQGRRQRNLDLGISEVPVFHAQPGDRDEGAVGQRLPHAP